MKTKPLIGHVSQETAYLVEDYPYGFKLRCKIRYWIEFSPKHGYRFCSQTSNPKRAGLSWNAPKKSTYSRIVEVMFLDENEHVKCAALSEYSSLPEAESFLERFDDCLDDQGRARLEHWIRMKRAYEAGGSKGLLTELVTEYKEGNSVDL